MYPTDLTRPPKTLLLLQPAFEGPAVPLRPFRILCTQLPFRTVLPKPIDPLEKDTRCLLTQRPQIHALLALDTQQNSTSWPLRDRGHFHVFAWIPLHPPRYGQDESSDFAAEVDRGP